MCDKLVALDKIIAVIKSCTTQEHIQSALNMVNNFEDKYKDDKYSYYLLTLWIKQSYKVTD